MRALRLFQGIAGGRSAPSILPQDWDLSVLKVPGSAWGGPGCPRIAPGCLRLFLLAQEGSVQSPSLPPLGTSSLWAAPATRRSPLPGTFPWPFLP